MHKDVVSKDFQSVLFICKIPVKCETEDKVPRPETVYTIQNDWN